MAVREAYLKRDNRIIKVRTIEVPPVATDSAGFQDLLRYYQARMLRPAERVMSQVDRQAGQPATGVQHSRRVARS